jgi:glycosyltransferase involved in cell wall biosynthesis
MSDLSIIIPTFNRGQFLQTLVRELLKFENGVLDIIVVDDASEDDIEGHLADLQRNSAPHMLSVISLERNCGAPHARNVGIAASRSPLIQFIDSDDFVDRDGLAMALETAKGVADVDLVIAPVQMVDAQMTPLSHPLIGAAFGVEASEVAGYHWHTMGAIYRRELIERVGDWNTSLCGSQDWEFQARAKLFSKKHILVPNKIGFWRQHEGERIGAVGFKLSYTASVIEAALAILRIATTRGRIDRQLSIRLALIILLHTIQIGAHCGFNAKMTVRRRIIGKEFSNAAVAVLVGGGSLMPPFLDRLFLRIFRPKLLEKNPEISC